MLEQLEKYNHLTTTDMPKIGRWYGTPENPYQYPSVSTICKNTVYCEGLTEWYKKTTVKQIDKRLKETSDIGTALHSYFDTIVNNTQVDIPPIYKEHCKLFSDWLKIHRVKPVKTEFVIVSEKYGYAGRVDFFGEVDGKLEVVDWKTGSSFGDTWGDQVAAYQMAISEMLGIDDKTIGMRILQIPQQEPKVSQFTYKHLDWMQDSFFLNLERFKRVPRFSVLKKHGWKYLMEKALVRK